MTTRTDNLTSQTGCVEDRTFHGAHLGELNQTPGADVFFSLARDIVAVTDGQEYNSTLAISSEQDAHQFQEEYTVHDDEGEEKFGGCGFLKYINEISADLVENKEVVFMGSGLEEEYRERAYDLVEGLGQMATEGYFAISGAQLVKNAVGKGASLVTYIGIHTADRITEDDSIHTSYDSLEANDPNTESKPSFNLDTNHAETRAEIFGIDPTDSRMLAKLLATSTVRILSNMKITKLDKIAS